jgi:hypothetical protein
LSNQNWDKDWTIKPHFTLYSAFIYFPPTSSLHALITATLRVPDISHFNLSFPATHFPGSVKIVLRRPITHYVMLDVLAQLLLVANVVPSGGVTFVLGSGTPGRGTRHPESIYEFDFHMGITYTLRMANVLIDTPCRFRGKRMFIEAETKQSPSMASPEDTADLFARYWSRLMREMSGYAGHAAFIESLYFEDVKNG